MWINIVLKDRQLRPWRTPATTLLARTEPSTARVTRRGRDSWAVNQDTFVFTAASTDIATTMSPRVFCTQGHPAVPSCNDRCSRSCYGCRYECFEGTFGDEALYPSQNRLSTRQVDLIWEQLQLRERENVCADINGGPRRDACSLDAADALGGAILATMSYSLCVDDIGNLNSGVACQDGATGTGFVP